MTADVVISVDGACSGRKAAAAAVLLVDSRIVGERSRYLWEVDGYVLAAEIAGVALAAELVGDEWTQKAITIELDNADVRRVIEDGYRPVQFQRIPPVLLHKAIEFCRTHQVKFRFLPRRSTKGLRRADRLASARLWRKGKRRGRPGAFRRR
jgi:ribonuclease HI